MSNYVATLPPKTTPLERSVALACAPLGDIPVPIRSLWNPDDCPIEFLPYLAWAFSVDRWDENWPESAKRAAVKSAYYIHQRKGTIAAVRRVVETLGYLLRVIEWWQLTPKGTRGTFALEVSVLESGITEEMYAEMERLIADAKPLSRHMIGLSISMEVRGTERISVAAYLGDEVTVYPYTPEMIVTSGRFGTSAAAHTVDTMTVQPLAA